METVRDRLARHLYEMWCISADGLKGPGDEPDWKAYDADGDLNPVGLKRQSFLEDADKYLDGTGRWAEAD